MLAYVPGVRHAIAAHEGDHDTLLEDPHSVASGRTLKEIALGTGKAPTPFMTAPQAWRATSPRSAPAASQAGASTQQFTFLYCDCQVRLPMPILCR